MPGTGLLELDLLIQRCMSCILVVFDCLDELSGFASIQLCVELVS